MLSKEEPIFEKMGNGGISANCEQMYVLLFQRSTVIQVLFVLECTATVLSRKQYAIHLMRGIMDDDFITRLDAL